MDMGDKLRQHHDDGAAAAAITVSAIARRRFEELGQDEVEAGAEREGVATIVRQMKHPDEVHLLRSVYGPRFVLLGAWSPSRVPAVRVRSASRLCRPSRFADLPGTLLSFPAGRQVSTLSSSRVPRSGDANCTENLRPIRRVPD